MNSIPSRLTIYARDVANITGLNIRTAQRIIKRIRVYFSKEEQELVTVTELCRYLNLDEAKVKQFL